MNPTLCCKYMFLLATSFDQSQYQMCSSPDNISFNLFHLFTMFRGIWLGGCCVILQANRKWMLMITVLSLSCRNNTIKMCVGLISHSNNCSVMTTGWVWRSTVSTDEVQRNGPQKVQQTQWAILYLQQEKHWYTVNIIPFSHTCTHT